MGKTPKIADLEAKWFDARNAEREAKAAYEAECVAEKLREFEAMGGVIGVTKVRKRRWHDAVGDMRDGPFIVTGAASSWGSAEYTLARLKKDGTASAAPASPARDVVIVPEDNQCLTLPPHNCNA